MCRLTIFSLATVLTRTLLPPAVLGQCSADKPVADNLAHVARETIPTLDLAKATIIKDSNMYTKNRNRRCGVY